MFDWGDSMEIKYQFFEDENLLIQKYSGLFSMENYIKYTQFIKNNLSFKLVKKVLNDFRELDLGIIENNIPDDFKDVIEKIANLRKNLNNDLKKNDETRIIFWVDKPIPTLVSHLFIDNIQNRFCNYYSCEDTIIRSFMLPESFNDLNQIISNLEKTFTLP